MSFIHEDQSSETGVRTSYLAESRLTPEARTLEVAINHSQWVEQQPRNFRRIASRSNSTIDGLEHEHLPLYSFQFHPEAQDQFARTAGFDPQQIGPAMRDDGRRLLAGFYQVVMQSGV